MFADQIDDAPPAVALLKMRERERGHFGSPQPAAQEHGQDGAVAQSPDGRNIRRAQQSLRLPKGQPVTYADALRLRALHAADTSGEFRCQ